MVVLALRSRNPTIQVIGALLATLGAGMFLIGTLVALASDWEAPWPQAGDLPTTAMYVIIGFLNLVAAFFGFKSGPSTSHLESV